MYKRIAKADIKNGKVVVMQPAPIPGIGISAGFTFMIEQRSTTDDVHEFEKWLKNLLLKQIKILLFHMQSVIIRPIHPAMILQLTGKNVKKWE